jgi:hypothetical protein
VVLVEREMGGKVWNPRQRWDTKRILLVFARGSSGRHGVGECWTSGGEAAIRTTIEAELAPLMVGRSVFEVAAVTEQVRKGTELSGRTGIAAAAWSGIETAVMDLAAKSLDLPLADLLGRAQGTVGVYASAGLYGSDKTPEDLAAEVKGWVDAGFDAVKIKVGRRPAGRGCPPGRRGQGSDRPGRPADGRRALQSRRGRGARHGPRLRALRHPLPRGPGLALRPRWPGPGGEGERHPALRQREHGLDRLLQGARSSAGPCTSSSSTSPPAAGSPRAGGSASWPMRIICPARCTRPRAPCSTRPRCIWRPASPTPSRSSITCCTSGSGSWRRKAPSSP